MNREGGSILKSKKIQARKRKEILKFSYIFALIIIVLVIIPPLIVRIPWFSIKNTAYTGIKTGNQSEVQDFVNQKLSESFLKVFPRSNFITFGRNNLRTAILDNFLLFKSIDFSIHRPNTLEITVIERDPSALWCKESTNSESNSKPTIKVDCYFIDSEGFIYEPAPTFSSPVYVTYKKNIEGNPLGTYITDKETFVRINKFIAEFANFGLKVVGVEFQDNDVINLLLIKGLLKVSLRQDDALTINNLYALISDPKLNLKNGDGGINVSYIDLRFGNKLFYK